MRQTREHHGADAGDGSLSRAGRPCPLPSRYDKGRGIAGTPGLVWKIWGIDRDRDTGVSAYLFASEASARAFTAGPMLERLRSRPDVTDVSFELAPIDQDLSEMTGAADALAGAPIAAAL